LPRLSRFGSLAPLINVALFSLYHFFTPWQALTRILAVTPLAWVVMRKRNLYISIAAHLALNTIGLLPALLRMLAN
jgi:membrane protease YdiL (CAAX protease family)